MDPQEIQEKVEGFAQKLLAEAHGDPVRALGLLVLVLVPPWPMLPRFLADMRILYLLQ